jgi:hypothetical protein
MVLSRPLTWSDHINFVKQVTKRIRRGALSSEVAKDRVLWRRIHVAKRQTRVSLDWIYHRCYFTYGSAVKPTYIEGYQKFWHNILH